MFLDSTTISRSRHLDELKNATSQWTVKTREKRGGVVILQPTIPYFN